MSGKRAKKLRKSKLLSKKSIATVAGLCLGAVPLAAEGGEVLISLFPHYTFPLESISTESIKNGVGGGLKVTYRPKKYFDIYLQGDYQYLSFDTQDTISGINLLNGGLGAGYHLPLTDRISLNFNADVGVYNSSYTKINEKTLKEEKDSFQNINVGATISFSYKLNSVVATDINARAVHYAAGSSKFLTGAQFSPALTLNVTKAFTNSSRIQMTPGELDPVFPVLYSWYENNPFGKVEISNDEDASITDVKVSFFQPQYMGLPKECGTAAVLKRGESMSVDLKAFFNEQMLELSEKTDTQATVIVEYKYLGQKKEKSFAMTVPVYGRNNMSWADDRCASVFVSSKDPAALWFAKYITSIVRDNVRSGVALNVQYAMGIFEALDQFGLNYVVDPTSAFADNVGTASIDFLQFPYQTLMYRGGDCDDLSILVCSLFEAIGIRTAFITIPGHIFMAFDSGLNVEQAREQFLSLDELIIDGDEVWVPLEITLTDEGFNKAWRVGAREWNQSARDGTAMMYKMSDSWTVYKPVSVPGATSRFTLPDEKLVGKLFAHSVDEYITKQITPQIAFYEAKLKTDKSPEVYNDFGVLYARYGLFQKAEQQFRFARRQDYLPALINTGNLYYSMKDFVRARRWYEEVLARDPSNTLAMLGIARCAYEIGDYDICDKYYELVYHQNEKIAKQFSYLGSFENTRGRSFTLADRLSNTIWTNSEYTASVVAEFGLALNAAEVVEEFESESVPTVAKNNPVESAVLPDFLNLEVAIIPEPFGQKEENDEEDFAAGSDPDAEDDISFDEPLKAEKKYKGILSQLEFEIISTDELVEITNRGVSEEAQITLVPDSPIAQFALENSDEEIELPLQVTEVTAESFVYPEEIVQQNDITSESVIDEQNIEEAASLVIAEDSIPVDSLSLEIAATTEVATEISEINKIEEIVAIPEVPVVENRAVPRFTKQPSETWAPEEAYTAEAIPGMRSYEEEMGEFQNEKAFLYQDELAFAVNPEEDNKKEELSSSGDLLAMADIPEVNPFSSFLSKEDAKAVEEITNYSLDEVRAEKEEKIAEIQKQNAVYQSETESKKEELKTVAVESETESKIEVAVETQLETRIEEIAETKVEEITETNSEEITEIKVENVAVVEVAVEGKAEVKKESKTEAKKDSKAEIKKEAKVESETAEKVKTKVETKADVEAKADVETETDVEIIEEPKKKRGLLALILSGSIIGLGGVAAAGVAINKSKNTSKKENEEEGKK